MIGKIYISPVGAVSEEMLTIASRHVGEMFGFETVRYTSFPDPDYAYEGRRGQYSSTLILRDLSKVCPPDAVRFLALTEADLFIPMVTFVYGQAQLSGKAAIVSFARLTQEFYGLRPDNELKIRRARKEIAHELGHTFGLVHCRERTCLMSLSTEVIQIDVKSEDFCSGCWIMLEEEIARLKTEVPKGASKAENKVAELHR